MLGVRGRGSRCGGRGWQADRRSWPVSVGFLGRHITIDSTLDSTDDSLSTDLSYAPIFDSFRLGCG
jgi:hypothetical protein